MPCSVVRRFVAVNALTVTNMTGGGIADLIGCQKTKC